MVDLCVCVHLQMYWSRSFRMKGKVLLKRFGRCWKPCEHGSTGYFCIGIG
jgi:hypothetical protein